MQDKLISIIIPAYNAEKYIERAVNSCVNQTYRDLEIIVVNDGSNDGTEDAINLLCEKHKNVLGISIENGGVSRARNVGIENAHGEFLMFLDADDELLPNAAESLVDKMDKHSADIVSAEYRIVREHDDYRTTDIETVEHVYKNEDAILRAVHDEPETFSACAKLYKKKAIEDIRFPEGKRVHEDSFFVFCCLLKKISFVVIDEVVYLYYENRESASRAKFSEKFFDMLILAEEKSDMFAKAFPAFAAQAENMVIKAHMAILHDLSRTKRREYTQQKRASIKYLKENAEKYISASKKDDLWLFMLTHNLFGVYSFFRRYIKFLCYIKD